MNYDTLHTTKTGSIFATYNIKLPLGLRVFFMINTECVMFYERSHLSYC